jgi:hypothetical protein
MSIEQIVQQKYGSVAVSGLSSAHEGVRAVAEAFGYSPEQLASIPAEANMGLSCGNPTAFASLRPGETVVLNAYAQVENQSGCCSPGMDGGGLPIVACGDADFHSRLADLLAKHDVNEYAASVKVYALKIH